MIWLAALMLGWIDPPGPDLTLRAAQGEATLRLALTLNGKPIGHDWDRFLDRLFDQADADGNKMLTASEAGRVFPVTLADGKAAKWDFSRADANQDAKVSPEEFRAYYRQIGFEPIVAISRPPTPEQVRLGQALFAHLDRNHDGKISTEEWRQAPGLLARFDENEDELLDPQELLTTAPLALSEVREIKDSMTKVGQKPDARLLIEIGERPETKLASGANLFLPSTSPLVLTIPGGKLRIKIDHADPASAFKTSTRDFFLALFADAAGKKQAMNKKDLEADPSLAAILGLFAYADRNRDGVLTTSELDALFDLVQMGLARQVAVILENRGQNLFDWLDDNADGRLDVAELARAARRETIEQKDLPASYRLQVVRGAAQNQFGPLRVPIGAKAAAPTQALPMGPAWFTAMDRNQDGYVSAAEFRGRPELFAELDRDKDGRISVQEAEEARR